MKYVIEGYLTWEQWEWQDAGRMNFQTYLPDPGSTYSFLVREHAIEVDGPEKFDVRTQRIAALEEQKQAVRAAFAAKITEIEKKIQELLALEMGK